MLHVDLSLYSNCSMLSHNCGGRSSRRSLQLIQLLICLLRLIIGYLSYVVLEAAVCGTGMRVLIRFYGHIAIGPSIDTAQQLWLSDRKSISGCFQAYDDKKKAQGL